MMILAPFSNNVVTLMGLMMVMFLLLWTTLCIVVDKAHIVMMYERVRVNAVVYIKKLPKYIR